MKVLYNLLLQYFEKEKFITISLVLLCIIYNLIQTIGISSFLAKITNSAKDRDQASTYDFFKYFSVFSILYLLVLHIYNAIEFNFSSKLKEWLRERLFESIISSNYEEMRNVNFVSMYTPINRISFNVFKIFYIIFSSIFPSFIFLLIAFGYFMYNDTVFGICFIIGNLLVFSYLYLNLNYIMDLSGIYEDSNLYHESKFLDQLNNIDKIIHRGQMTKEINSFSENAIELNKHYLNFAYTNNNVITISSIFMYSVMICSIGYFITQYYSKNINLVMFITIMYVLNLHRDRISNALSEIPDFIDCYGRIASIYKYIEFIDTSAFTQTYKDLSVQFNEIRFDDVLFLHEGSDTPIFNNISISLDTTGNKIIGMNGNSGSGKSTFVKLILKIHKLQSGNIYIDDVDIKEISPDYLRENIVYVNQSGKLFDKMVVDNMLYACNDDICKERLAEIMSYRKITSLFKNMDIHSALTGSLGENLSGGQRQVVNIINGLIHPSKIMILDEPTNALDGELKRDVIDLIHDFKKYKQCIFVITHDSEMDPIFDEVLKL